ncbi:hypothetical protein [Citrobacter portucalensis]|uniref:hypothetical protein n=1 Tax=Citrobacter portucalensis TaxID=1639133 RepID=UPI00226B18C7|nr:hypothetical protein [Citrobacter portucalensis]MCX8984831.1 hypothetical protein [Citrobacter portucalensis]
MTQVNFINGSVRQYRQINADDAQLIYEVYGDETICDGDKKTASQFVNLEISSERTPVCAS